MPCAAADQYRPTVLHTRESMESSLSGSFIFPIRMYKSRSGRQWKGYGRFITISPFVAYIHMCVWSKGGFGNLGVANPIGTIRSHFDDVLISPLGSVFLCPSNFRAYAESRSLHKKGIKFHASCGFAPIGKLMKKCAYMKNHFDKAGWWKNQFNSMSVVRPETES